ncbi:hypothetical protein LIER_24683 [Lithospermum erythrorhizon]|uniref:Reverse transcriptase domain-containing protein n=1 Tax=Lithospermum erythrorhizon TaxID=34254 RepID=A0AAV3R5D1_LITER
MMELMGGLMEEMRIIEEFRFHSRCKEIGLTHLLFADDMFLLCGADCNMFIAVDRVLKDFSRLAGFSPNLNKSKLYFAGVGLSAQIGIGIDTLLVKYLGVPLITARLTYADSYELSEKIIAVSELCFVWATCLSLPKSIIRKVEKKIRSYLWHGDCETRGHVPISWKMVYKPNEEGGLGVKSFEEWNRSCLLKVL